MEVSSDGGETILMVEDDELVRVSVKALIESLGYRVVSARNGREALEIMRQDTPIDLLCTDSCMPCGMQGPQLGAEAPRLGTERKVLYTSGPPEYSTRPHGPCPGSEQLNKPYGPQELAAKPRGGLD